MSTCISMYCFTVHLVVLLYISWGTSAPSRQAIWRFTGSLRWKRCFVHLTLCLVSSKPHSTDQSKHTISISNNVTSKRFTWPNQDISHPSGNDFGTGDGFDFVTEIHPKSPPVFLRFLLVCGEHKTQTRQYTNKKHVEGCTYQCWTFKRDG